MAAVPRLSANLTLMFCEVKLLDRFEQAAQAGFHGVEIQAPYDLSVTDVAERLRRYDLIPVLYNVLPALGAVPGREREFRAGVTRALRFAEATGCRQLHCLSGSTDAAAAEATLIENLRWASDAATPLGVRLLIEPLNTSDNPGYFLTRTGQARRIIEEVMRENVRLQYDFYHMQLMEGCLAETVKSNIDIIGHFQIGGVPGRHEPGADQKINYPYLLDLIDRLGYDGWVGCEYRPRGGTVEGLGWARAYGIGTDA